MPGHVAAACPDQVCALDFLVDQTADRRPIKILTVTDEHTREALATPAARRITSDDTVEALERVVERRGSAPAFIRCDMESFNTLLEAQLLLEDWRQEYNHHRPHQSLSYETPAAFARQCMLNTTPDPHNKWTDKRGQVTRPRPRRDRRRAPSSRQKCDSTV